MEPFGVGRILGERYELVRKVARGGMGVVWEARDLRLDRAVAVKVMTLPHGQETKAHWMRFEREARMLAGLNSPHIAQVHDYGSEDGRPYLVQEFLAGEDLAQRLKQKGAMIPEDADRLMKQIAKGLHAAHDAGIVHRDLKPANIYLANVVGEEEAMAKVLDFGVAKEDGGDFTETKDFLGTLPYMSPEQTRGAKHVDKRSDIWSAGVILFQVLTGSRPFAGQGPTEIIRNVREGDIPAPSVVLPQLGTRYDEFFERALARDVDLRFSSIREMSRAFSEVRETSARDPASALEPRTLIHRVSSKTPTGLKAWLRHSAPRFLIAMVLGSLLGIGARVVASAGTEPAPLPTIEANPDLSTGADEPPP